MSLADGLGGRVSVIRPQDSDAFIFQLAEETDSVVHKHLSSRAATEEDSPSAAPAPLRELPGPMVPTVPPPPDEDGDGPPGAPTGGDYDPAIDGWHVYDDFSGDDGNGERPRPAEWACGAAFKAWWGLACADTPAIRPSPWPLPASSPPRSHE